MSLELEIRHAKPKDAEQILALKRATWFKSYVNEKLGITKEDIFKKFPDSTMSESISNWQKGIAIEKSTGDRYTYVAVLNNKVVGFTSPYIEETGRRRVGAMYVDPDYQGKGIGRKLLETALNWHGQDKDVYLEVVEYNQNAIDFYKHFGFIPSGKVIPMEISEEGEKLLPQIEMVRRVK